MTYQKIRKQLIVLQDSMLKAHERFEECYQKYESIVDYHYKIGTSVEQIKNYKPQKLEELASISCGTHLEWLRIQRQLAEHPLHYIFIGEQTNKFDNIENTNILKIIRQSSKMSFISVQWYIFHYENIWYNVEILLEINEKRKFTSKLISSKIYTKNESI